MVADRPGGGVLRRDPPCTDLSVRRAGGGARAAHGEREEALADLQAAEERSYAAEPGGDDAPGPWTRYAPEAFHYQRGEVLLSLGDRAAAVRAFEESLPARPPDHHIAHVLTQAQLAETLLPLGELERALDRCRELFAHYPYTSSRRTTASLTSLHRTLAPPIGGTRASARSATASRA